MYTRNAEIKAGLVVLAASLVLIGLLFFATGGKFFKEYRGVHLRLEVGALAPREGDPVFVNGVEVGTITSVGLRSEIRKGGELRASDKKALRVLHPEVVDMDEAGRTAFWKDAEVREIYVAMRAEIEDGRDLPDGTWGVISESLVGGRTMRLVLGVSKTNLTDEDTRRNPIPVKQAATFESIAAQLEGVAAKAETFLDGATGVTDDASLALEEIRGLIVKLREEVETGNIAAALRDVAATAESLKRTVAAAESRMEEIAGDVADAAADIRKIAATGVRISDGMERDVGEFLAEAKSVATRLDDIVERAGPKIDRFLDDANRTAANLASLSEDLKGLGPDARAFVKDIGGDVDTLMDLLIDTGHNLLDTSEDVRAHPWKILNEPSSGEEIAYENLRTTMQSYVRAMSRMNLAAGALRQMLAKGVPEDGRSRELYQRTLAEFERSVDRYRQLERRLVELLEDPQVPAKAGARGGGRPGR